MKTLAAVLVFIVLAVLITSVSAQESQGSYVVNAPAEGVDLYSLTDNSVLKLENGQQVEVIKVTEPDQSGITWADVHFGELEGLVNAANLCQYQGTGSPQPENVLAKIGEDLYYFNPATTGCAFIVEGRFPWQDKIQELPGYLETLGIKQPDGGDWLLWDVHHVVANNLDFATMNALAGDEIPAEYRNGVVCAECSVWFYDPSWNMNHIGSAKPSIAEEFEAAKYADMQDPKAHEPYLWPRIIWDDKGQMNIYYNQSTGAQFYAGCTSGDAPELIPVHGLRVEGGYYAAVGKLNCVTVAWIDGTGPQQWTGQRDADNGVEYQDKVDAWLMPATWSQDQINTWIASR